MGSEGDRRFENAHAVVVWAGGSAGVSSKCSFEFKEGIKMLKSIVVAMSVVLTLASAGYGLSFDDVQVEYWTGEGANSAMMIVDFGQDAANYAFGYRWNGEAYSYDMISSICDAGLLDAAFTDWGAGAYTVDSISYASFVADSNWTDSFLGYWGSADGVAWTPHDVGISSRLLQNGDWDGWSVEDPRISWTPLHPPVAPLQTPEPTTIALMAVSAAALFRRRRIS
jgi:hypothetical protein